jgi:hypothetical protein
VKGDELIRKPKRLAKDRKLSFEYEPRHGIGSHGRLFLGDRFATSKDRKKDIGRGLLHDMLTQLGVMEDDLR